ncbi:MAG TPA: hypothetical protein VHS31_19845 [Tepidisphaeraceae bacterium]|nr:hypothetical protein [Tepidisphaeraceae bacterium]
MTGALLISPALRADQTKVKPEDQLQFQQKTIQAQMQELQERMFHLAELTREMEPGDSAKLIMAVRKAREALIVEQMKEVLELLGQRDLDKAGDQEQQVLAKLEELKKLLMNDDMDLQMQLEQLKKLQAAIAKLDAAIKEEKHQRDQSGQVAEQQKQSKPVDPQKFQPMKAAQQTNHQTTDDVSKRVAELGDLAKSAAAPLSGASGSMGKAEGSLGSAKAGDAANQQQDAVKNLEDARAALDQAQLALQRQIEGQVRKQVLVNLSEMLERQQKIREASVALEPRAVGDDREGTLRIKQLALAEQHIVTIADQTIDLIKETQFSVALPPALQSIQRRCIYIVNDFQQGRDSDETIGSEKQVERDLQDLIDTFKQLAASKMSSGQCNCKGDKNKLLAELKVLRMLQNRVNEETADTDGRRAAAMSELSPAMRDKIGTVRDSQQQVQDALDNIRAQLAAP